MLKIGDRVMVLNQNISGEAVEEGTATIRGVYGGGEYEVRFDDDENAAITYRRRITPEQKLPPKLSGAWACPGGPPPRYAEANRMTKKRS